MRNAIAVAVGSGIGILAGALGVNPESLLFFALFWQLTIAVHEGAHVLAGSLAGLSCRGVAIFGCHLKRGRSGWRLSFQIGNLFCGATQMLPLRLSLPDWRYATMIAAGPAANILLLATLWWARWPAALAICSLTLFSLVPLTSEGDVNDVARLASCLHRDEAWERWKLTLFCLEQNARGVPRREWNRDALCKAASFGGGSAADRMQATLFAYGAAIDCGQFQEAGLFLESALALSGRARPVVRSAVFLEAALFQAQCRRDAVTARAWLTQASPAKGVSRASIAAVEAAVRRAEGWPGEAAPSASPSQPDVRP